jgi:hypothetical protein
MTTTAAALGPLYARAAAESILQDHLTQAGSASGLWLRETLDIGTPHNYERTVAGLPKPGQLPGYDTRVAGFYTPEGIGAQTQPTASGVRTHLVWKDGFCAHLVIVSGHCPTRPGEAMASERTIAAGVYDWHPGSKIYLSTISPPTIYTFGEPLPSPAPVKIVGTYRPKNVSDPYWFGQYYFDAHPGANDSPDTVDSLFVSESEFTSQPSNTWVEADFDYPLTTSAVRLDDVPAERAAVDHLLARYAHRNSQIVAETGLPGVLDAAAHERHLVNVGTLLVTIQLALLAWLVLFQVMSDAIEARGNEIAMAKLRGHSPGATVRFGLAEPLVLLAGAVPIGLGLALLVTHGFADSVLVPGVPVVVTWAPVVTALIAFGGGLLAAVLAGYRTLTRSVLDQWRHTTRRPGHGRTMLLMDALLAAAAVTGLVLLRQDRRAGHEGDTAALLAPGLLVFAVAIIGVRLLPLACRRLSRSTRASRRIGPFLASRQVSRRPVGLRLAAFLAVAVGLATFAVAGESIAAANRDARAGTELGAHRVATVQFNPGLDPVAATRKADPDGKWAMTAATWLPDGGDSVTGAVLGVDSSRLAVVGNTVPGGMDNAQLARTIGAAAVGPLSITARQMRVHLDVTALSGDRPPDLQINLRTTNTPYLNAEGAPLRRGANSYVVPVACARGCTLRGLTWDRPILAEDELTGTVRLTGLDVQTSSGWKPLDIGLGVHGSWRPAAAQGTATDRVAVGRAGIVDRFTNSSGGYGGIAYASAPSPMPAVATPSGLATDPSAPRVPQMTDATGTTVRFHVQNYVPVLPAVLDNGVMFDVDYLQTELPAFLSEASWQVWLGPHAPKDAMARLAAAGLQVQSVRTQSARVSVLARQAPALALLLLVVCAIAGAVLAVGGTAISISASSRRRSYEIAALRAVGVSRRSLLRASVLEQLLLLGTAVLLGVPTGLVAARLAMPIIPEFADHTPIALHYTPQWLPTLGFAAAFIVLLTATAFVAAWALMRIAVPSRLREAEG